LTTSKKKTSARLPQFSKLTTSKTKDFCETSFKNGKISAALTPSCQCVLRFFYSTYLKYCACHEKLMPAPCCKAKEVKGVKGPSSKRSTTFMALRSMAEAGPQAQQSLVGCVVYQVFERCVTKLNTINVGSFPLVGILCHALQKCQQNRMGQSQEGGRRARCTAHSVFFLYHLCI